MTRQHSYETLLETSRRINWRVDDLVGGRRRLDFSRPFLPETFARTAPLRFLAPNEKLLLNHIRAHCYLALFEIVEAFVVPFVTEQASAEGDGDTWRRPALLHFVDEEVKHMQMFRRVRREFVEGFGVECGVIGPAEEIGNAVLKHSPLAVTIAVLGLEWMSQAHYVESVKDDQDLDVQFKNLLRHHWMEEAQHAKLDALLLQEMAAGCERRDIDLAIEEYFEIGAFFDAGFRQQAELDLAAFESAAGRQLLEVERAEFLDSQHGALRWTFLGSAMLNQNFLSTLGSIEEGARARVKNAAAGFC